MANQKNSAVVLKEVIERINAAGDGQYFLTDDELKAAVGAGFKYLGKADIGRGDYANIDFEGISLHGHMPMSHFVGCDFEESQFHNADLRENIFEHCQMQRVTFRFADLTRAEFRNCNLENIGLWGADLDSVKGLKAISSVGSRYRLIYAYVYQGETRIQAGCRNATPERMREAINMSYGGFSEGNPDREDYLDAVLLLERWGEREMTRLASL